MAGFVVVGVKNDLSDGRMKEVTVDGKPVLLAMAGGKYYALQGRCAHMGGTLADGTLKGTIVECPRHHSQFDVTDGRVVRWMQGSGLAYTIGKAIKSPTPLAVYTVKIEQDKIMVKIA